MLLLSRSPVSLYTSNLLLTKRPHSLSHRGGIMGNLAKLIVAKLDVEGKWVFE